MELSEIQGLIASQGLRWQAGDTSVSGLPDIQQAARLGYVPGPGRPSLAERERISAERAGGPRPADAETAVDWRNRNGADWVTPIRDQGNCGACVAFAVIAPLESQILLRRANPGFAIDLSEAAFFFCYGQDGNGAGQCPTGNWTEDQAMPGLIQGVTNEACFPYTDVQQACNLCSSAPVTISSITGWSTITDTDDMKAYLAATGPLATGFTVYQDFLSYTSGVYTPTAGSPQVGGHSVAVIGYADDDTLPSGGYWICKNSWGTGWGEDGFFQIAYGVCGIDAEMWGIGGVAFYPQLVRALYNDMLGRDPVTSDDQAAWAAWIGELTGGEQTYASVVSAFQVSYEYCTDTVLGYYRQLLDDDDPDPNAVAPLVQRLMFSQISMRDLIVGLCTSTAFQQQNPVPTQFVTALYQKLLSRDPQESEVNYWVSALQTGTAPTLVAKDFVTGVEYCTDTVTGFYQKLLGRQPAVNEATPWVTALTQSNFLKYGYIQAQFLVTQEYLTRALSRFS